MARRKRSRRDNNLIANTHHELDEMLLSSSKPMRFPDIVTSPLTEIEDLRTYHPLRSEREIVAFTSGPEKILARPSARTQRDITITPLPHRLGVTEPNKVIMCVRRQQRKEVLHALRKTGRGQARRKPRRTWRSDVHCK